MTTANGTGGQPAVPKFPIFDGRTVLVLGEVMLDRYVTREIQRVSPEGPILVLRYATSRIALGGAGNVANNIAALVARAMLVGAVGDDAIGRDLVGAGVKIPERMELHLAILSSRPTTMKTRFMSGMHQLLRLDEEVTRPLEEDDAD